MRICGICHVAHGLVAVSAIENALGVIPPLNGRVLRELLGLINRLQSHVLHLILVTPDVLQREYVNSALMKELNLLNKISKLLSVLGGAPTHPPNIVIGGVEKVPDEKTLNDVIRLAEVADDVSEVIQLLTNKSCWSEGPKVLMGHNQRI